MNLDQLVWLSWFVAGGRWDAAEVSVFEAVGVAAQADDFGVVDQAVDHRGGDDVVAEDLTPAAEGLVGGDDQRGAFVFAGDEPEEQVRCFGSKGMYPTSSTTISG